jgi:hypothetical protein
VRRGHSDQAVTRWANSNRRAELPSNWDQLRRFVERRAGGLCQAVEHVLGCDGIGTDCDHIGDRDDHSPDNLQWLSVPCHRAKTREQSARYFARARRQPERHPTET